MSRNGICRTAQYSKGSLGAIGREVERASGVEHRNADIDPMRRECNFSFKPTSNGMYHEFNKICKELNVSNKDTIKKKSVAFEGMLITASPEWFKEKGYVKGMGYDQLPKEIQTFFCDAYDFAKREIGIDGTDENILSAVLHLDETTPHLQMYYVPLVRSWNEKVYEKDENGKVKRTATGSPIQARDENGKIIYNKVENSQEPRINRTELWRQKGGRHSYTKMQDRFFKEVSQRYGLERGEIGSDSVHRTKNQWEQEQVKKQTQELSGQKKILENLSLNLQCQINGSYDPNTGEEVQRGLINTAYDLKAEIGNLNAQVGYARMQLRESKSELEVAQKNYEEFNKSHNLTELRSEYESLLSHSASLRNRNRELKIESIKLNNQIDEQKSILDSLQTRIVSRVNEIMGSFMDMVRSSIQTAVNDEIEQAEGILKQGQSVAHSDAAQLPKEVNVVIVDQVDQVTEQVERAVIRPRKRGGR